VRITTEPNAITPRPAVTSANDWKRTSATVSVTTPISGFVSSEQAKPTAVSSRVRCLIAVAERARFFNSWLATDRARHPSGSSDRRTAVACRPGGCATPEELWYRNASMGFAQVQGLPGCRRQSRTGSHCGRSALTAYQGRRHSILFKPKWLNPSHHMRLAAAVVSSTQSSASYRMVCAPSACGSKRGQACAPKLCAPG